MSTATLLDIAMSHSESMIEQAKLGDRGTFNKLVSLWYKRIYNFSLKYFNDHDHASDASQKTFIKVFDHLPQLKEVEKFKPWIYVIALNQCREEDRKNGRLSKMFVQTSEYQEKAASAAQVASPEREYVQNELSEIVMNAINQLSEEQKTVLIMKEYEGLKFREIAEVMNVSENTVKSRLYYGLSNLKKILENNREFNESYSHGK